MIQLVDDPTVFFSFRVLTNKPTHTITIKSFMARIQVYYAGTGQYWDGDSTPSVGNLFYLSLTNTDQLSLAIPPWAGAMSTGQSAVMLCGWGLKAGMARVWWLVKLCEPLYNSFVISERFTG